MFRNYFHIALRNLLRYKLYSVITMLGLSVGVMCCLLFLTYVQNELSYDRFHKNADNVYRVTVWDTTGRHKDGYARTPALLGPALQFYMPEIRQSVRFLDGGKGRVVSRIDRPDVRFLEDNFFFTDQSMFNTFSFFLKSGNSSTALRDPNSVILTEGAAKKYFGDENPIGRRLNYENKFDLTVTGILADPPPNSHLQFEFLASMNTMGDLDKKPWDTQGYTFLLMPAGISVADENDRLQNVYERYVRARWWFSGLRLRIEPLTGIYLHSEAFADVAKGDWRRLYVFSAIAFLILLIAVTNYVNMITARTAQRAREVGVRKVMGADRKQLVWQFLCESMLISVLAVLIAIVLTELALPVFNNLLGKHLQTDLMSTPWTVMLLAALTLLIGLLSGIVPALFLSAFRPVNALKGFSSAGRSWQAWLRPSLVVAQFGITVAILFSALVIQRQLIFMQNADLGFDKEQVINIPLKAARAKYKAFKQELADVPGVSSVAASSGSPMRGAMSFPQDVENQKVEVNWFPVDADFIPTLGIKMTRGRNFSTQTSTDSSEGAIINESYARLLGTEEPIGKVVKAFGKRKVIGVIRDFHTASLHQPTQPTVLAIYPDAFRSLLVRINLSSRDETLEMIRKSWQKIVPDWPFEFSFLNDEYDALYRSEERLGQIFNAFAALAIFIACLGLFGLASYTAERRTKEIGVRKVLGASNTEIVTMFSGEFLKLVAISNLIAWPIAYLVMQSWLEDFAYRVDLGWWMFAAIGGISMLIAFGTVSAQAFKAARANPVEALRYE